MKKLLTSVVFSLAACATHTAVEEMKITDYKPGTAVTRPTVYMFTMDGCKPCEKAQPVVQREARARGNRLVIVHGNNLRRLTRLGYTSLPVFRFVKPGAPDLVVRGWEEKRLLMAYQHFDADYAR